MPDAMGLEKALNVLAAELRPFTMREREEYGELAASQKLHEWIAGQLHLNVSDTDDRVAATSWLLGIARERAYERLRGIGYWPRDAKDEGCQIAGIFETFDPVNTAEFYKLLEYDDSRRKTTRRDYLDAKFASDALEAARNLRQAIWLGNSARSSGYNHKVKGLQALLRKIRELLRDPNIEEGFRERISRPTETPTALEDSFRRQGRGSAALTVPSGGDPIHDLGSQRPKQQFAGRLPVEQVPMLTEARSRELGEEEQQRGALSQPAPTPSDIEPRLLSDAKRLGRAVKRLLEDQEAQHGLVHPYPLPVTWSAVPIGLADQPENVMVGRDSQLPMSGSFSQILQYFSNLPSGRLVVLGKRGSGKTALVSRLALDMLEKLPNGPVPIRVNAAEWNGSDADFRAWFAREAASTHPIVPRLHGQSTKHWFMAKQATMVALLERRLILPIVDGLDEMDTNLRASFILALHQSLGRNDKIVLTSRDAEYKAAVLESGVLQSAAAIQLDDLSPEAVEQYLVRARTETDFTVKRVSRWREVLKHDNDRLEANGLRDLLRIPFWISLTRTVYESPASDPMELVDQERFPDQESICETMLKIYFERLYPKFSTRRARFGLELVAYCLEHPELRPISWWGRLFTSASIRDNQTTVESISDSRKRTILFMRTLGRIGMSPRMRRYYAFALKGPRPWEFERFIFDAYRLGILRRVGQLYEFRHLELQKYLSRDSADKERLKPVS